MLPEKEGESNETCSKMDELAEDVRRHVPEQLVTANKDEAQAADITSQSLELEYLHKVNHPNFVLYSMKHCPRYAGQIT